jgi:hypothetical protein
VLSKYPGQTFFIDPQAPKSSLNLGANWTDFPVMNMHPHAWPLYSIVKLLGVGFNEKGFDLAPTLPLDAYEFTSPLMGLKKSPQGFEGWYAPLAGGVWSIALRLPAAEAARLGHVVINGSERPAVRTSAGVIEIEATSTPGQPLRWSVRG